MYAQINRKIRNFDDPVAKKYKKMDWINWEINYRIRKNQIRCFKTDEFRV